MEKFISTHLLEISVFLIVLYCISFFCAHFLPEILAMKKEDWKGIVLSDFKLDHDKFDKVENSKKANLGLQFGAPRDFLKKHYPKFFEKGNWVNEEIFHLYDHHMYYACEVYAYYFKEGILVRFTIEYVGASFEGRLTKDIELKGNKVYDNMNGVVVREIDLEEILQNYKDAEDRINRLFPRNRYNR